MPTILISGGSGLVGKHLSIKLIAKGYDVAILSRTRQPGATIPAYYWDIDKNEIDKEAIETSDYIIHLAGENLGEKRWTPKQKQHIIDSRVKSAQLIFGKVKNSNTKLKAFISASAVGYYGASTSNEIFSETDSPTNDFLSEVCQQWEQAADNFKTAEIRTVKIRCGVVLSKQDGALTKMITPVKLGIGSAIGTGMQYIPWIHIDDLCNIYIKAIEDNNMEGVYNAVAPDQKTNKEFTKTLAQVLHRPFWFPNVPAFIIKLLFGEMSAMLLNGSRVSSDKIRAAGYDFLFPELKEALKDVI